MKHIMIVILVISAGFFMPIDVQSQNNNFQVESQNLIFNNEISPSITAYMTSTKKGDGVFAWFFVNEYWAEGYAGIIQQLLPWLQVSFGFGLEQAEDPWRVGGSIWAGSNKWSALLLLEEGGSGFWHRAILNHRLNRVINLGFMSEQLLGIGPRIEINVPGRPYSIWSSLLQKEEKSSVYLTVKFSF